MTTIHLVSAIFTPTLPRTTYLSSTLSKLSTLPSPLPLLQPPHTPKIQLFPPTPMLAPHPLIPPLLPMMPRILSTHSTTDQVLPPTSLIPDTSVTSTNILRNVNIIDHSTSSTKQTTLSHINNSTHLPHQPFSIYYQNTRGLNTKISDFSLSVLSSDYDVIALTETWLKQSVDNTELFGNSYFVYRCDRSSLNSNFKRGGGVLIAVKSCFSSQSVEFTTCSNLEIAIVKIVINRISIFILCLYIPSGSPRIIYDNVLSALNEFFNKTLIGINDLLLLCGDFNLPYCKWMPHGEFPNVLVPSGTESDLDFLNSIHSHGLFQINNVSNFMGTLLDLVFLNTYDDVSVTVNDFPLVNIDKFHLPFEVILSFPEETISTMQYKLTYNFKHANFEALNQYFENLTWNVLFLNSSIDTIAENLHDLFEIGFGLCVPKRKVMIGRFNDKHPVWFNRRLRKLKNLKTKAYKRINYDKTTYFTLRHQLNSELKTTYRNHIDKIQRRLVADPQSFWSFVNSSKKTNCLPSTMNFESVVSCNPSESCSLFKSYFSSVYTSDDSESNDNSFALDAHIQNHIPIGSIRIYTDEVLYSMLHLNKNKGVGPDDIPPVVLIQCASSLASPLCRLFNLSLSLGYFPNKWKISFIKPVFKSGSRSNVKNYRGISIASSIAKLFDSLVTDALTHHFLSYLSPNQHAYVKGRSTTTNLLEFVNAANSTLSDGLQIDAIYTDFSKAFDKVNHAVLLNKLNKIGIHSSLLNWISSYLQGRYQYVKLSDCISELFLVTSGVPQGSHIGPLLFILFIDDIVWILKYSKCLIYADDIKLFTRISCVNDMLNFQRDLNSLSNWCVQNRMTLNVSKCKQVSFYRNRPRVISQYHLMNERLEILTEIRDLGVLFSRNLSFNGHIDMIVAKAYSMLGFVKRCCRDFNNLDALKSVYCAHVRSHLEYAAIIWTPYYSIHSSKLESIQKKFVLFALRHRYARISFDNLPSYISRCNILNLPLLSLRRKMFSVIFIHDVLSHRIDAINILSQIYISVPCRSSRTRRMFKIPFRRTNFGLSDPLLVMLSLCNDTLNSNNCDIDFSLPRRCFKRVALQILSIE